jgi:regulator of nonsense transcripts 1
MPLMQRLVALGVKPSVLRTQYRMHPVISAFPSAFFYRKLIGDGLTEDDRKWRTEVIPWPKRGVPLLFWNVDSREENYESAMSYVNTNETACVGKLLESMVAKGVAPEDLGVITPYAGQRAWLIENLPRITNIPADFFDRLEIASVDAFQGREKNFIIFSAVRANSQHDIGFLKDRRRICVSLTRARYGLIVIANAPTFAKNKMWVDYITHCMEKEVFVTGSLDHLTPSQFQSLIPATDVADLDDDEDDRRLEDDDME